MTNLSTLSGSRLDEELGAADSTVLFTDARRKSAINRGMREFADLTECYTRRATITIAGGTAEYDLNASSLIAFRDFVRFSKDQIDYQHTDAAGNVKVLSGDDLKRRDVDWLNRYQPGWQVDTNASSVTQYPIYYYLRPESGALFLGFWPTPCTGSSESAVVRVPYIARPIDMSSTGDEPYTVNSSVRIDLRPYHQALVHYAAHQLEKLRRDDQASDRQLQKFMGYVQRFWSNARQKNGNTLTSARQYFRPNRTSVRTVLDPRI